MDFRIIDHKDQRYPTCGDYWCDIRGWHFRASRLSRRRYSWLILVHEFTEWLLIQGTLTDINDIDRWDMEYERLRPRLSAGRLPCGCWITRVSEPGDDIHAPYHRAHRVATAVERLAAMCLWVRWADYEREVESL